MVLAPASTDLAAQTFRAELFAERGFVLWSEAWYGGFHVLGYSVLYPPLAALLGVRAAGALAALAAAALFALLARRRFGGRALLASLWFAAGAGAWLFTGRMTFLLGVAFGLAALLAADARRLALAATLAALTALASPVTGVFVGLAGLAAGLAGARREAAALALPAAAATLALGLAFPTTGEAPFVLSSFVAVPLFAAGALWLIPPHHRALRIGVALYAVLALAAFAIPTPLGGNVVRLGALFGGPLAALVLLPRPLVLAAVAVPLLYWQLQAPVRDVAAVAGDPSTERAYYEPLLAELERDERTGAAVERVHVPPTLGRWESAYVAERFPLARGWLRQLETDDRELFDGGLTPQAYAEWLEEHGVSHVALADAELDWLSEGEAELIEAGPAFLRPLWRSEDWRLYRVVPRPGMVAARGPSPPATEAAGLGRAGPGRFVLEAGPGDYLLRLRWTRYWQLEGSAACLVEEGGWTRAELDEGGRVELWTAFSLPAALGRGRVCSR